MKTMTDQELDRKLHKLEEMIHDLANRARKPWSILGHVEQVIDEVTLVIEISMELTREIIRRVQKLESGKID